MNDIISYSAQTEIIIKASTIINFESVNFSKALMIPKVNYLTP
jgi:hypothetical protein